MAPRSLYDLRDVIALMRDASMSSTYKAALLKSLGRIVPRERSLSIPLETIAAEFLKLYWNQTIVFHLRQAAAISKEAEVIKAIRNASERYKTRHLADLPAVARDALVGAIARILTINVLECFHTSEPPGALPLFTWTRGQTAIALTQGAVDFIAEQRAALEVLANYRWAERLEKFNALAPAVIEKVSRDGVQRGSLTRYVEILTSAGEDSCFYCERKFGGTVKIAVDHLLPWSFLLSDPVWDLVLACVDCNSAKSDILPAREFVSKLAVANDRRSSRSWPRGISPLFLSESELSRYYEAAISVEWPGFWSPAIAGMA